MPRINQVTFIEREREKSAFVVTFIQDGANAVSSFCIHMLGNVVFPPERNLANSSQQISMSHLIELYRNMNQ